MRQSTTSRRTPSLDCAAFRQLHRRRYLEYTGARLNDPRLCHQVVDTAFATLDSLWPQVISSPCPEAMAWTILGALVSTSLDAARSYAVPESDEVYEALPPAQADVVILRCKLELDTGQAADLMGVEAPTVTGRLRTAERQLPAHLVARLRTGA